MKKIGIISAVAALLITASLALAIGPGGRGAGRCGGPGIGACDGSGFCGGAGPGAGQGFNEQFFEETADLRRQLHDKRFEYKELARGGKTDEKVLAQLEEEMDSLRDQIREKAPEGMNFGRGMGRGPGQGPGMMRGGAGGCCQQQ